MKDLDVSKMATDQIKKVAHQNKNPIIRVYMVSG